MARAILVGVVYFTIVLAAGFVFGMARVLLLAPSIGHAAALFIELPLILGIAWWISGLLIDRFAVAPQVETRLAMGGTAFLLLMIAEGILAATLAGVEMRQHFASFYGSPAGLAALISEVAFGLFPTLHLIVDEQRG